MHACDVWRSGVMRPAVHRGLTETDEPRVRGEELICAADACAVIWCTRDGVASRATTTQRLSSAHVYDALRILCACCRCVQCGARPERTSSPPAPESIRLRFITCRVPAARRCVMCLHGEKIAERLHTARGSRRMRRWTTSQTRTMASGAATVLAAITACDSPARRRCHSSCGTHRPAACACRAAAQPRCRD